VTPLTHAKARVSPQLTGNTASMPDRTRSKWSSAKTLWKRDIVHMTIAVGLRMVLKSCVRRTLGETVSYTEPGSARSFSRSKSANSDNDAISCTKTEKSMK
jgi:hypothetical protein